MVSHHKKISGKYHVPGKLVFISNQELKELFEAAMPILRTSKRTNIIIIGPMPRYVVAKCCDDPVHITNFHDESYSTEMAARLKETSKHQKPDLPQEAQGSQAGKSYCPDGRNW